MTNYNIWVGCSGDTYHRLTESAGANVLSEGPNLGFGI